MSAKCEDLGLIFWWSYGSYNNNMLSSPGNFEKLVARLSVENKFSKAIEQGASKYQIKQFKISNLGPS